MSLKKMTKAAIRESALALLKCEPSLQIEFFATFAKNINRHGLIDIAAEVVNFSDEVESICLCRLARAINERDAGPAIGDDC